MNKLKKSVILFHSTNYAIWTENKLRRNEIECKLINVPRHLSSDCGYCVEINSINRQRVENIITEMKIDFDRIEDL